MSKYIDIGVNLTGSSFKKDLPDVIERALDVGVQTLVVTGTDLAQSIAAVKLAQAYPGVCYATVGVHPHHASDYSVTLDSELRDLLKHSEVLAVGECGLDFNRNFSSREEQIRAFESQMEIAADCQKPLFLHQRDAQVDFVSMINTYQKDLGLMVAHCFTGNTEEVKELLALDLYIGVTGWICDERRGADLQKAVQHIPLNKIMLETDAPYLLPRDLSQKPVEKSRNEPCYLPHIASSVAKCMQLNESLLISSAYENSQRFFSITDF